MFKRVDTWEQIVYIKNCKMMIGSWQGGDNVHFNLQKLRYERLSRKISQEDVADALGISRNAYYKKENGLLKISVEEFWVILNALNIPTDKAGIFFEHDVPKREREEVMK